MMKERSQEGKKARRRGRVREEREEGKIGRRNEGRKEGIKE